MQQPTTPSRRRARGNGDGSIYQVGDRFRVAVSYRDPLTGQTKRKVTTVKTRREAERLLVDSTRAREAGLDLASVTVEALLTEWLRRRRATIAASTWRTQASHVRIYLNPILGHIPISKLTASDVENLMAGMVARGLNARTARAARTTLGAALSMAVRDGRVARNAAALAKDSLPALEHREMTWLSGEETAQLIRTCEEADTTFADLVIVAATTGLRQGELLGLSWRDVELKGDYPVVNVRHSLGQAADGTWRVGRTKTKKSQRQVPLASVAVAALKRQEERQAENRARFGTAWRETNLVFTNEAGEHLLGWNVSKTFAEILVRAKLRSVRFHDLRHTCASLWLEDGLDLKTVSELLGHTSIAITADIYGHVSPARRQIAADSMNRRFATAASE